MAAFTYTFVRQQSKLSQLLGDPNTSTDDQFPLADRKAALNMAEVQFAKDGRLLKNYVTGTVASGQLDVPSDWVETHVLVISDIVITNDKEIALQDWQRYYADAEEAAYHYYWEFSGTRRIKFIGSTVNGKTYQLWYFAKPTTELDLDADVSTLPLEYREAPVYLAAAELMEQIGKTQLSDRYRNKYAQYVLKAQLEGEKHFVNKEMPRPDLGEPVVPTQVDRQGQGYPY